MKDIMLKTINLSLNDQGYINLEEWAKTKNLSEYDAVLLCKKEGIFVCKISSIRFAILTELENGFSSQYKKKKESNEKKSKTIKQKNNERLQGIIFLKSVEI